jgi:vacuolar-type H+-ATPase subunit F/Vma7
MRRIVFLTPVDVHHGFALAGVRQLTVGAAEAETVLAETVRDPTTAVVILDERLLPAIPEPRRRELERLWPGVLLVLPAPAKGPPAEDYALRLVRRAIGYQVRLNR